MCLEFAPANVGTPYGRRTIEDLQADGYVEVSAVDPRYGTVRMVRPCCHCSAASPEECATLKDLGRYCETAERARC